MAPSILGLSPELLHYILDLLAGSDIPAVRVLLYVSKTFYNLALPFSVRSFVNWRPSIEHDAVLPCDCNGRRRILGFLRYVTVAKPGLAREVRSIATVAISTRETLEDDIFGDPWPTADETYSRHELKIYRDLIEGVTNVPLLHGRVNGAQSWHGEWLEDLDCGLEDAQLAVLLVACPKVQYLSLARSEKSRILERLFQFAAARAQDTNPERLTYTGPRPLDKLVEFNQESIDTEYGHFDFEEAAATLFALPSLRVYEGLGLTAQQTAATAFMRLSSRSSNVEHMFLAHWETEGPKPLKSMMSACKNLKTLDCSFRSTWHNRNQTILPQQIVDLATQKAHGLEKLTLRYKLEPGSEHADDGYMGTALREMTSLKSLVAGSCDIVGVIEGNSVHQHDSAGKVRLIDCIPEQLECLCIRGCGTAMLDQIQQLLKARPPRLRHLRLLFMASLVENPRRLNTALSWDPERITVEIELQTDDDIAFDEDEYYCMTDDRRCGVQDLEVCSLATRIYDPTGGTRRTWLARRGEGTFGKAGFNEPLEERRDKLSEE